MLCPVCNAENHYEEIPHTVKSRGNPDRTMTYTKKGFRCSSRSFFFSDKAFLKEEEKMINRFANQA